MAKRCTGSCTAVRIWTTIEHAKSTARSSMRRNEVREGHRCSSHAHAKLHARPLNGRCLLSTSERKNQTACPTSSQGIRASRIWVHEAALNKAHGCGDALPCCCTACPQPARSRHSRLVLSGATRAFASTNNADQLYVQEWMNTPTRRSAASYCDKFSITSDISRGAPVALRKSDGAKSAPKRLWK